MSETGFKDKAFSKVSSMAHGANNVAQSVKTLAIDAVSNQKDIRIISIGPSGVGKSTIGNRLLKLKKGDPRYLHAEASAEGVTTETTTVTSDHISYTDVPGIPDPRPTNTKKYYNMIIEEAKKPCTVIFIVFAVELRMDKSTKDRIRQCSLLFDEINKSSALKFLILNDMKAQWQNPDGLDEYEDEEDYLAGKTQHDQVRKDAHKAYEEDIKEASGVNFNSTIVLYGLDKKYSNQNMTGVLEILKKNLQKSGVDPVTSDHLRTFEELQEFALQATEANDYQERLIKEQKEVIERLQKEYADYKSRYYAAQMVQEIGKKAGSESTLVNVATLGAAWLAYKLVEGGTRYFLRLPMLEKEKELNEARSKLSEENLENAVQEYKRQIERFEKLKEAMEIE